MNKLITAKLLTMISIPMLILTLMIAINAVLWSLVNSSNESMRNIVAEKTEKLQKSEKNNINLVYKQRAAKEMFRYFLSDDEVLAFMSLIEKIAVSKGLSFQMGGVTIKEDEAVKRAEAGLTIEGSMDNMTEFLLKINQSNKVVYISNIHVQHVKGDIYRMFATLVIYI